MTERQKPSWDKNYGEIWQEYRDNPNYRSLHVSELRRIHLQWKRIAAEIK